MPPFGGPPSLFLNPRNWRDWSYWEPPQEFFSCPPYERKGDVSFLKDLVVEKSLDLVPPDIFASQAVVPDTWSEDDDEEIALLFVQEHDDTDYNPNMSSD